MLFFLHSRNFNNEFDFLCRVEKSQQNLLFLSLSLEWDLNYVVSFVISGKMLANIINPGFTDTQGIHGGNDLIWENLYLYFRECLT